MCHLRIACVSSSSSRVNSVKANPIYSPKKRLKQLISCLLILACFELIPPMYYILPLQRLRFCAQNYCMTNDHVTPKIDVLTVYLSRTVTQRLLSSIGAGVVGTSTCSAYLPTAPGRDLQNTSLSK